MTATGKAARRQTGLNHSGVHRARHSHKNAAKIKRAGWTRTKSRL